MKEIRETKLVEQTTVKFIAEDGKEFANEQDCVAYERRLNFEKLNPIYLDIPFVDWYGRSSIYKVRLDNKKDLDKIIDYETISHGYYLDNYLNDHKFIYPCEIVCIATELYIDCVENIQSLVDRFEAALKALKS